MTSLVADRKTLSKSPVVSQFQFGSPQRHKGHKGILIDYKYFVSFVALWKIFIFSKLLHYQVAMKIKKHS